MIQSNYYKQGSLKYGPSKFEGSGMLLYEYVRGSEAYGLATETSDIDRGGIYLCSNDDLLGVMNRGVPAAYQSQVTSDKHDEIWYELSRFCELLFECNPNILESLFIDDEFVIYEHPVITELKKHRDEFVTKACFDKFGGYAVSQIRKARGLNKKIVKPVLEKKSPLDFCYTFYEQGSTKIENWLAYRNLKQEFCGLVSVPNMHNTYGVYYDWGSHIDSIPNLRDVMKRMLRYRVFGGDYDFTSEELNMLWNFELYWNRLTDEGLNNYNLESLVKSSSKHYKGIVKENSLELCLSSVPEKDAKPICYLVYNQEGYSKHAQDYTSYKKWEKERNPERFALNQGYAFDAKNMCHAMRLVKMCLEIASGEGVKVRRTEDREYLLKIKNHKYTYDEIMKDLEELKKRMDDACEKSLLPDKINFKKLNRWLLKIRKNLATF